jgi:hypothetical protein
MTRFLGSVRVERSSAPIDWSSLKAKCPPLDTRLTIIILTTQ